MGREDLTEFNTHSVTIVCLDFDGDGG